MAKNREGSINLFGAVQAKTEDGIVAHADGIAVEYDENGKPIKTLEQAIEDGSLGGSNTPKLALVWDDLFDLSSTKEKFNNIDITEELYEQVKSANKLEVEISNSTKDMKINLVLQTTQIEEQDKLIRLGLTTDKYFIEVGLQLLEDSTSGYILFQFREILGVIDVEELPPATIDASTEVPSSGHVGKVYFNTKLSVEEVNEILEGLEYVSGILSSPCVAIATNTDMSQGIVIMAYISDKDYVIMTGDGTLVYIYSLISNDTRGWLLPEVDLNIDNMLSVLAPQVGMTIQNSKLKNLISITPFEEPNPDIEVNKLYRTAIKTGGEWSGTVVPNSGTVEKVYLNTSLSDEEIANILSQLTYDSDGVHYVISSTDAFPVLTVITMAGTNGYVLMSGNEEVYWVNQEVLDITGMPLTAGWQEFTNPIEINTEVDSGSGLENDKLTSLISTTPFVQSGGEIVGYKYYQFVEGEWKELGSGGEVELPKDLPVVIEKEGNEITDVTFTEDDWNIIKNNTNVILKINVVYNNTVYATQIHYKTIYNSVTDDSSEEIEFFGYAIGGHPRNSVVKRTTDGTISISTSTSSLVNKIDGTQTENQLQITSTGTGDGAGKVIFNKATTITSANTNIATSKAVYDFVTNYMTTNYGNGDTEEF